MEYKCKYCKNIFSSVYNMHKHQKKARYCIELQDDAEKRSTTYCDSCGKQLSRSDALKRHKKVCDGNELGVGGIESILVKRELADIKKTLEEIKAIPDVKKLMLNNLEPVIEGEIRAAAIEFLTIKDILQGVEGLVSFVVNYPLGDRVICSDRSRRRFRYKDENGKLVNDYDGVQLSQTFFRAIDEHNQELISKEYSRLTTIVKDIVSRGAAQEEDVGQVMLQAVNLQTLAEKCNEIAMGGDNDIRTHFVKKLSKQVMDYEKMQQQYQIQ